MRPVYQMARAAGRQVNYPGVLGQVRCEEKSCGGRGASVGQKITSGKRGGDVGWENGVLRVEYI